MIDIRTGDCRKLLREIPAASVHCVVTSPPYWGQRDYGVDGMIGLEPSVDEWVAEMGTVFAEVWRVLRDDGTLWLNLGDKYAGSGGAGGDYNPGGLKAGQTGGPVASRIKDPKSKQARNRANDGLPQRGADGLKAKDLMGLPWRVAFALQAAGWWLRCDIIWSKPNPMPQSVTDRPSTAHEYLFLLAKAQRYFYDADAVRETAQYGRVPQPDNLWDATGVDAVKVSGRRNAQGGDPSAGRTRRSVWTIATEAFPGPHYATFPTKLVEPCIKAGTSERGVCPECGAPWTRVVEKPHPPGEVFTKRNAPIDGMTYSGSVHDGEWKGHGQKLQNWLTAHPPTTTGWRATCDHDAEPIPATVLDCFSGAGTTGLVAQRLGRDYIGLELNPEYVEMSRKRIADDLLTEADERIEVGQAQMFDMAELRQKPGGLVGGVSSWQEGPGAHTSIVGRHSH